MSATKIHPGVFTAAPKEPFVVFLIGMRLNKLWAVHKWLPLFVAMPRMLIKLFQNPDKGLLGARTYFTWREVVVVQYWRSFDDLEAFARAPEDPHLPAWQQFNKRIGKDGTVGIWHETYTVNPGQYEGVYGNMPVYGLAAATEHISAEGGRRWARQRFDVNSRNDPEA